MIASGFVCTLIKPYYGINYTPHDITLDGNI